MIIRRSAVLVAAFFAFVACARTHADDDVAPSLLRLTFGAPPRTVIRAAAEQLTAAGFLVTTTDSLSHLRAEREQRPGELDATLTCHAVSNPAVMRSLVPTMIVDLATEQRPDGRTDLTMEARVRATYMRLTAEPARPSNFSDCRSSGQLERQLTDLLKAVIK